MANPLGCDASRDGPDQDRQFTNGRRKQVEMSVSL